MAARDGRPLHRLEPDHRGDHDRRLNMQRREVAEAARYADGPVDDRLERIDHFFDRRDSRNGCRRGRRICRHGRSLTVARRDGPPLQRRLLVAVTPAVRLCELTAPKSGSSGPSPRIIGASLALRYESRLSRRRRRHSSTAITLSGTSVATDTCGQVRVAKFSDTFWVYWIWG